MYTEGSGDTVTSYSPTVVQTYTTWNLTARRENESTTLNLSDSSGQNTECQWIKQHQLSHNNKYKDFIQPMSGILIFRMVLAGLVVLVNVIVAAAIVRNWSKLRQNIYIFAFNLALCDFMLGVFSIGTSVHHLAVEAKANDTDDARYMYATGWFFSIRTATFMTFEVASAGNTALIALAFSRYVSVQTAQPMDDERRNTFTARLARRASGLLSRKKSHILSCAVWLVSLVILCVGLVWNCTLDCTCYLSSGVLIQTHAAAQCQYRHRCSYLFPSQKIYYTAAGSVLFLLSLLVVIITCVYTIRISGGMAAVLPYRFHLNLVRKRKQRQKKEDDQQLPSSLMRRNSMQLAYMRSMTHFILAITCVFIVCRVPINLLMLMDSFSEAEGLVSLKVAQTLSLLAFLQSLLNPIIFYVTLHRMKRAIYNLFTLCCVQTVEMKRGVAKNCTATSTIEMGAAVNQQEKTIRFEDQSEGDVCGVAD